jgi:hypothetical protein
MEKPLFHEGMLSGQLRGSWEFWCQETEAQDNPEVTAESCDIADKILKRAMALVVGESLLTGKGDTQENRNLVDRRLDAHIGATAISKLSVAETRLPILEAICRMGHVNTRVQARLNELAQLYLWGFDRQLLVLSRVIIEACLDDAIEHAKKKPTSFKLCNKIKWAWSMGLFKKEITYHTADWLRLQANMILHSSSEATGTEGHLRHKSKGGFQQCDGSIVLLLTMLVLQDLLPITS